MRHIVSQTVVIQKNYIMLHKKKEKTLVCYYFFLIFAIISLTTMKTRPFSTGIVVTIPTAQHLSERNAKAGITLATVF